jgi:hypothetical protein
MIRKSGSGYVVKDSSGSRTLGRHATHAEALAQLRAIEASKARRGKKSGRKLKG